MYAAPKAAHIYKPFLNNSETDQIPASMKYKTIFKEYVRKKNSF